MIRKHHVKFGIKHSAIIFLVSFILLSFVGAYYGIKGKKVPYRVYPAGKYEEIQFTSHAKDKLILGGWYLPADSNRVAVIVHGWAGNWSRYSELAKYLQDQNINVLTFDLRGGTGKNTYGYRESLDVAAAVEWLKHHKNVTPENITLIGASMGGAASVAYARHNPTGKMVLIGPVVDINQVKYKVLQDRKFILPHL